MGLLDETQDAVKALLAAMASPLLRAAPADQPVHTLYWPADRFDAQTVADAGAAARKAMADHAPTPEALMHALGAEPTADDEAVWSLTSARLQSGAVEDLRIDFEDGYGVRPDAEEDAHAEAAAAAVTAAVTAGTMSPRVGIRVKCLEPHRLQRAAATIDRFIGGLRAWPQSLVVTVPKVTRAEQARLADALLAAAERKHGCPAGSIRLEVMVETTDSLLGADGRSPVPAIVDAGVPRLLGVHLGVYDFTASCQLPPKQQRPDHPYCDLARALVRLAVGDRVHVSDGASNVLPVGDTAAVHDAWRIGTRAVLGGLQGGYPQGWDMHPAQLVVRHAANIVFFRRDYAELAARLSAMLDNAVRSSGAQTVEGAVIDEPATGQALLRSVQRAWRVGALTEAELRCAGMSVADAELPSFSTLVSALRGRA